MASPAKPCTLLKEQQAREEQAVAELAASPCSKRTSFASNAEALGEEEQTTASESAADEMASPDTTRVRLSSDEGNQVRVTVEASQEPAEISAVPLPSLDALADDSETKWNEEHRDAEIQGTASPPTKRARLSVGSEVSEEASASPVEETAAPMATEVVEPVATNAPAELADISEDPALASTMAASTPVEDAESEQQASPLDEEEADLSESAVPEEEEAASVIAEALEERAVGEAPVSPDIACSRRSLSSVASEGSLEEREKRAEEQDEVPYVDEAIADDGDVEGPHDGERAGSPCGEKRKLQDEDGNILASPLSVKRACIEADGIKEHMQPATLGA
mmetsp:Transcript_94532/g.267048  ORF Transcript_94532/g.267048 Transcript_94532/m.267048 type:complete len:337 (-) Transcript_94532:668-1678(-)